MNIVIPLGGIGVRFQEENFYNPKPLIRVKGKEIIRWVIDSLKIKNKEDKIFIIYNPELENFGFSRFIKSHYPNIILIKLEGNTIGPCDTISKVFKYLSKRKNHQFLICDGDTFYEEDIIKKAKKKKVNKIFYFKSYTKDPIYSYLKIKNSKLIDIEEKVKISNDASVGAYLFRSTNIAKKEINEILKKKFTIKEYYVSMVYKQLLINKQSVYAEKINKFTCLGTPELVREFDNYEKKRFCFDLDNTLVTYPVAKGNYKTCKPIQENINFLNFLYKSGHYIIIYTARRMRTYDGNIEKVKFHISDLTKKQLKKFDINYHELIFGKPYADIYIDDLSIDSNLDLHKASGFFQKKYNLSSRSFNKVNISKEIITKKSTNKKKIQSEIYYLKNIPSKIKKFYPKVIKSGKDYYQYKFLEGKTYSDLFINEQLNSFHIEKLFKTIKKIHSTKIKSKINVNIYSNYLLKLKERIKKNDIKLNNKFLKNNFKYLQQKLLEYEKEKLGNPSIIHGDPVFTNIISHKNNINFIDPRGILDDKFTIYGDNFYDYAKIYQSLYGYDFVINNREIPISYTDNLRKDFEKLFINKFSKKRLMYLKYLTASLYFSLVSFHKNTYQKKFNNIFFNLLSF